MRLASTAALRAVANAIPVACPLLAPCERTAAHDAELLRQIGF